MSLRLEGNANVRWRPEHYGYRTESDGDGISILGSRDIWIDHCTLSRCKDGLIDAVMGSTGITISQTLPCRFVVKSNLVCFLSHENHGGIGGPKGMFCSMACFSLFREKLLKLTITTPTAPNLRTWIAFRFSLSPLVFSALPVMYLCSQL